MGLSLVEEQGGNPCLAGNVYDVRTANQRVALVERLTSTTVGIVIDEPNRRFWVEFDS